MLPINARHNLTNKSIWNFLIVVIYHSAITYLRRKPVFALVVFIATNIVEKIAGIPEF